jgi:hypothetical protein
MLRGDGGDDDDGGGVWRQMPGWQKREQGEQQRGSSSWPECSM